MTGRLEGRVALVFGAGSSGDAMSNGRAAALVFAREGALVAAVDRDEVQARRTAELVEAEGGRAVALVADVTREDEVAAAVEATVRLLGTPSVLHNNVGLATTGDVPDLELATWERSLAVNLGGVFLTCKHTVPLMLAAGYGAIVNVSSLAGIRSTGYPYPAYMTAKAAVNQLTVALALRYAAQGLRANAVLPGVIDTPLAAALVTATGEERDGLGSGGASGGGADCDGAAPGGAARDAMSPTGRSGTPWDVAHAALFLASDEAAYVNGVCLPVDGGLAARSG